MMARWADLEDEENDRFPKRNHDKQGNGNDHFDKSQQNHLGNIRKLKPDQEVVAVERNPRGNKSENNDTQFESLAQTMPNTPPLPQAGKRKD
jgi:hypothetical protein